MAAPNRGNQRGKPKNNPVHSKPLPDQGKQLIDAKEENESENNSNTHHPTTAWWVNMKKWERADIINVGMLIVTTLLMLFTYRLYKTAIHDSDTADTSAKAATNAATIAQQTFEATKRYNDSSLVIQKRFFEETKGYNKGSLHIQQEAFVSNTKDSKERFTRDTTALGLQIKSLKQNQEQFIKQNEPYLQLYIDSEKFIGATGQIFYTLVNLTPIPVKITSVKSAIQCQPKQPVELPETMLNKSFDINYYVIKEAPQGRRADFFNVPDTVNKFVNNGAYFTYWQVIFKYQNLISGKQKTYRLRVKLTKLKNKRTYADFIYNDNSEEK